jgi:uncharacterized membrane protein (GlpM family)
MAVATRPRHTLTERSPAGVSDAKACWMHSAIEYAIAPGALWHLARQLRYRSTGTVAVMQCFHWAFKFASLMLGE